MDTLYRRKDVLRILNVSRTALWRMEREEDFPRPVEISKGRKGYLDSEITQWMESRKDRRGMR